MTTKRIAILALGMLALSACDRGVAPAPEPTGNAAADNGAVLNNAAEAINYRQRVIEMTDNARNGVFLRAIRDAGFDCQGVQHSLRLPDANDEPVWRAECTNGPMHLVTVSVDGIARITSRTDVR